jgi:hypothetical protein
MEHWCTNLQCDFAAFDNNPRGPNTCPKCGSPVNHTCDEVPEDVEIDEPDESPDEEEEGE